MRKLTVLLLLCASVCATARSAAQAQSAPVVGVPEIHAIAAGNIDIDGRLDEAAWKETPAFTGFVQRDPDEGKPTTERTIVRFLYDDRALYVGAELRDSDASQIVS